MYQNKPYLKYMGFKSIFYFCSLPLRLDSYRGCTHGCLYCFSQRLNNRAEGFHRRAVPADPERFRCYMESLDSQACQEGLVRSCLRHRVPIHFGCVSDPFPGVERETQTTLKFLKVLVANAYPFVLSTKSSLVSREPYLNLLSEAACSLQLSFSTLDNRLARALEPGAPSPRDRLKAMEKLAQKNVYTVARLQPLLYPLERVSRQQLRAFADAGAKHVIMEHLRIPTNSSHTARTLLWRTTGMDFLKAYKDLGIKRSRISFELARNAKLDNIMYCREEVHRLSMTFGSGDNDFHHMSDTVCCCGVPNRPEFANTYKGHLGAGAFHAMRTGRISWTYMDREWQPEGSTREHLNSDCRSCRWRSVIDLLKHRVQNHSSSNSPTSFFGIEHTGNSTYRVNDVIRRQFLEGHHNAFFKTR
jgi:DNA repair photolyase